MDWKAPSIGYVKYQVGSRSWRDKRTRCLALSPTSSLFQSRTGSPRPPIWRPRTETVSARDVFASWLAISRDGPNQLSIINRPINILLNNTPCGISPVHIKCADHGPYHYTPRLCGSNLSPDHLLGGLKSIYLIDKDIIKAVYTPSHPQARTKIDSLPFDSK